VPRPEDLGVTDPLADGRRALELGRPAEALHHFGQLLAEHPDHPWGWHGRGDALQAMAEPEGALEAYRRAAELQPRQGLHRGGECNALSALGRSAEAEVARQAALSLDPSLLWMWEGATAGARRRPGG
jgi:tetratricopeptide (TPR) repeat protein